MESLENNLNQKIIKCPKCGSEIEITEGYVQWCEHCLWNLKPDANKISKDNVVNSIYKKLGKRLGKELFQSMVKSNSLKPGMTLSKLFAYLISCAVFSISIINIVLIIYLLTNFSINVIIVVLCLFLSGMAIAAFPRIGKVPQNILSRTEFPALYKLADSITKASGSEEIYGIVIDGKFNASYTEVGLKRRKIIYIGLPLYYILDDEEKVALLSHEIAHGINGDITKGLVMGTALKTLISWYKIFAPGGNSHNSAITMITNVIMLVLSKIILMFIMMLVYLVYNDSQRAEYLADYIGASISGTNAMKSLLIKLRLGNTFSSALQRAALSNGKISFFHELLTKTNMVPKKEIDRINMIEKMEGSSLDATHPPTADRISFMEQQGNFNPKFVLSEADSLLIEKEIEQIKDIIETQIIDGFIGKLYY